MKNENNAISRKIPIRFFEIKINFSDCLSNKLISVLKLSRIKGLNFIFWRINYPSDGFSCLRKVEGNLLLII